MRANVNLLTAAGETQLSLNITGYTDLVAAHVSGDWGKHNQFLFYPVAYAEYVTGHTITDGYLLRVQLSGTNTDGTGDGVFTMPAILTGVTVISGSPPIIVVQPVSQSVTVGTTVTLTVSAISATAISYQWRKTVSVLGVPTTSNIVGATEANLVIPNVQLTDTGSIYDVVVSNTFGSVTSTTATLTVTVPSSGGGGGGGSGGGGCFTADTFITMANGSLRRIKDIKVGDSVRSYSIAGLNISDENAWRTWQTTYLSMSDAVSTVKQVFRQSFNGFYQILDLSVTYEHPLLSRRDGVWKFRRVVELKAGDSIVKNGVVTQIVTPAHVSSQIETYNLNTEDNDVFLANGVVAHNSFIKE